MLRLAMFLLATLLTVSSGWAQETGIFFDGEDDHIQFPMINFNEFDEGFTIEVWCQNWGGYILSQGNAGEPENSVWLSTAGGMFDGCGWECNEKTSANLAIMIPDVAPSQWLHVAMVYDGKTQALFVDGKEVRKRTCLPPGNLTADRPLIVGAEPQGDSSAQWAFGGGLLHALRISSKPRYREDFEPKTSWENDEATELLVTADGLSGNKLMDESAHQRNGKVVGASVKSLKDTVTNVIEGRVVGPDAKPVGNAFVSLMKGRKVVYMTRTTPDSEGRFRIFVNNPSTDYTLLVDDRSLNANGRWTSTFRASVDKLEFAENGITEVVIEVKDITQN